ncbi:hypothetical protein Ddye_002805 [Dipteronia dyeriana]|uniref:Kinetochore protein NDC80 n=1 Tax=Dipteronia dyeriana TaxID=168575 RepID=A0AAD9XQZ3_9ROSI|nr:hypothetical protein Ddye_002805 [Dipteronia dyeriana]
MRGANRRRPTESFKPPPPQQTPDLYGGRFGGSRDSDASFASSRPSSVGMGRASITADLYSERSYQISAIRAINSYLSSQSFQISLPPKQVPSVKDITEIIKFLMSQLDYPPTTRFEDDLFVLLKSLNCPYKINKSTLRSPNSPHNWPSYLALIHWMVQIASYTNNLLSNSRDFLENNSMYTYALDSYMNYISGDDDAVEEVDREFIRKLEKERDSVSQNVKELAHKVTQMEALQTGPTEIEKLEKEKSMLEEDINKFNAMISGFDERIRKMEELVEEKEKEIKEKLEEHKRICHENDELKKKVELQTFNARDVERMKKELQAVERDIEDAETARSAWEDKCWDLDGTLTHTLKKLEERSIEGNQTIRRLKLSNDIRFVINAKGSTPAEVMGIDYKSTLKPTLESFADEINKSSMEKLEELISIQQQSSEMAAKIEGKRNRIAALQSYIDEVEAQLNLIRKEMQEHTYRCAAEVKKMMEDVQIEAHDLDIVESEAAEVLKAAEVKLQEAVRQSEEETQIRASELLAIVDSVSKHKEYMESKISEMKSSLSETALTVSEAYKNSLPAQFD